jgi:uncharacterized damage-inducible protein DinB
MPHPLVLQLRFTRSEFKRGLEGLTDADARRRLMPMNCITWNIGHLAWQEQRYWLTRMQNKILLPKLNEQFCYGCEAVTPPLDEIWEAWQTVVKAADPFLDTLSVADLQRDLIIDGQASGLKAGNLLQRMIYHYWYHLGESLAIRQQLGHTALPEVVGDIDGEAPYQPEK